MVQVDESKSWGGIQGAFLGGGGGVYGRSSSLVPGPLTTLLVPWESLSLVPPPRLSSSVSLPAPPTNRILMPLLPPVTVTRSSPPSAESLTSSVSFAWNTRWYSVCVGWPSAPIGRTDTSRSPFVPLVASTSSG